MAKVAPSAIVAVVWTWRLRFLSSPGRLLARLSIASSAAAMSRFRPMPNLHFRVTVEQKAEIEARAKAAGYEKLSPYLRDRALDLSHQMKAAVTALSNAETRHQRYAVLGYAEEEAVAEGEVMAFEKVLALLATYAGVRLVP